MARKMGRRVEYDEDVIDTICDEIDEYVENTEYPMFIEFCFTHKYSREYLYELMREKPEVYENLSYSVKMLFAKAEIFLEKQLLTKPQLATGTIFRLKNKPFRYSDRLQSENLNYETKTVEDFNKAKSEIKEMFET